MKDKNRYWLVVTGPETEPGINGGLLFRREHRIPKMAIKGVVWLAYCKDTKGNLFSLMQEDSSAR